MVDLGLEDLQVIYTVGVNYDTKYENEFIQKYPNIEHIQLVDHTIDYVVCNKNKFIWNKQGIEGIPQSKEKENDP